MTAPHRLKDLADVLELIRAVHLTDDFGQKLDPYVQSKYGDLWPSGAITRPRRGLTYSAAPMRRFAGEAARVPECGNLALVSTDGPQDR